MKHFRLIALFTALTALLTCCTGNEKYVNMFIGSAGDHGQMTPAATVPFGMISLCPDSRPGQHGGYDYDVTEISGISINRISGAGCRGVGGNLSILPAPAGSKVDILKDTEKAYPGYYETGLSNGVKVALTATKDMAVEQFTFSKEAEKILSIDFTTSFDDRGVKCGYDIIDSKSVNGWIVSPTACARGRYKLYFTLRTDEEFTGEKSDSSKAILRFAENIKNVEVRISISSVDLPAAESVAQKWEGYSFGKIRNMAKQQWREKLSKIDVYGSTEDQKGLFYSLLYRIYLSPMDVMSDDMRYKGTDGEIYQSDSHRYYSSWSMWDTFRTKFPLLAILEPEVSNDICWSLAEQFRCGKQNWATPHESAPTIRTEHSIIVILDCLKKGITDFSFMAGYKGMKDEADYGLPMKSPDQVLESSYDLWAIAQIAEIAGREDDAARYRERADSLFYAVWPSEFMNVTSDFTKMRNNGLYQGSRWQYRWAAPHFIDKMIALAGKEQLESELDFFFDNNLLNQGNEPCLHIPFIYNLLDAPEKTQKIVRALLTDENMIHLYGGNAEYPEPFIGRAFQNKTDGFAPEMDEDDGAMSAWYLFCSMGFYPVCVGTDSYEVFSPLYDKLVIDNGKAKTTIRVKGRTNSSDVLKSITINGQETDGFSMKHSVFEADTEIVLNY